ncbi:MAG: Holliday junction branch migration protein RuvA [Patescibacteria group bacterium]
MISQLRGEIVSKGERAMVLDVNGVGYRLQMTAESLGRLKIGQTIRLQTYLAVREDALELFGFETSTEASWFTLLLTVPGIGPKSALAILSLASPEILHQAIATEDTSYLTRVSGIGKKSAEKIILTLKDKLGDSGLGDSGSETNQTKLASEVEALEALKALGYSAAEARDALKKTTAGGTSERIKAALKTLGGH